MSVEYRAVQWNRQKRVYDLTLVSGVAVYLILFAALSKALFPFVTDEIMLIRAFGSAAFVLLHVVLCIGPLCRLNPVFLPLLYNRRHMGVTTCLLGCVHAIMVLATYHIGGDINPFLSIFVSGTFSGSVGGFPFQPLGFFALIILVLMAATSHDFWLANLTAPVWKALHMLVYLAYALLVLHVTFGVLQSEVSPVYSILVGAGLVTVLGLHLVAGMKERRLDEERFSVAAVCDRLSKAEQNDTGGHRPPLQDAEFIEVCAVNDIPENRACIVCLSGERVAVFKYEGKISVVSNVCQHQNGPLGEGKIMYGCITCPWHGYQYQPDTGASPPPFVEKVPTFDVRVRNGRVYVHPKPNPPGTRVEPALVDEMDGKPDSAHSDAASQSGLMSAATE